MVGVLLTGGVRHRRRRLLHRVRRLSTAHLVRGPQQAPLASLLETRSVAVFQLFRSFVCSPRICHYYISLQLLPQIVLCLRQHRPRRRRSPSALVLELHPYASAATSAPLTPSIPQVCAPPAALSAVTAFAFSLSYSSCAPTSAPLTPNIPQVCAPSAAPSAMTAFAFSLSYSSCSDVVCVASRLFTSRRSLLMTECCRERSAACDGTPRCGRRSATCAPNASWTSPQL